MVLLQAALSIIAAIAAAANAVAAFVLVRVTGRYTELTQRMVEEMREARLANIRPRIVPVFEYDEQGARTGGIYLENVGEGAALDIEATVSLEPGGLRTSWHGAVLRRGQRRVWSPTLEGGPGRERHPVFPDANPDRTHVRAAGHCRDAAGVRHDFDEMVPLRDDWKVLLDLRPGEEEADQ